MSHAGEPRAFRPEGLLARGAPFAAITIIALFALILDGPGRSPREVSAAVAATIILFVSAALVPWHRLPRWSDALPPLAFLLVIFDLRRDLGGGFPALAVAPLFLVPTFWIALYGSRGELGVLLAVGAVMRFTPAIVSGHAPGELGASVAAFTVTATVCAWTQNLVRKVRQSEETLRDILDRLPVGFFVNHDGKIVYANLAFTRAIGLTTPAEVLATPPLDLIHPDDRALVLQRIADVGTREGATLADVRFLHAGGGEVVLESQPIAVRFAEEPAIAVALRDVTDARLLEAAEAESRASLALERARMAAILSSVHDGVALLDEERRGVLANRAYLDLFGLTEAAFAGMGKEAFLAHVATVVENPDEVLRQIADVDSGEARVVAKFVRPRRRIMRRTVLPVTTRSGRGHVVVWTDITAESDLVDAMERDALTDALTGLVNRRGGMQALRRETAWARRHGSDVSLAMLDIDHFKRINDSFGHDQGDAVLQIVAQTLVAEARATDTIARWGGEEFLAILPVAIAGAGTFCERVQRRLATTDFGPVGEVTLSGGVTALAPDEEVDAALARADRRLYQAKAAGRNRVIDQS